MAFSTQIIIDTLCKLGNSGLIVIWRYLSFLIEFILITLQLLAFAVIYILCFDLLPFSLLSIYLLQNYSSSSSSPMHSEVADESGGDTRTASISSSLMAPSLLMRMRKIAFVLVGFFFKHGLIFSRMRLVSYHH